MSSAIRPTSAPCPSMHGPWAQMWALCIYEYKKSVHIYACICRCVPYIYIYICRQSYTYIHVQNKTPLPYRHLLRQKSEQQEIPDQHQFSSASQTQRRSSSLFAVCCLSFLAFFVFVCYCLWCVASCLSSVVCCLLCDVRFSLFVVCCLLACCLLCDV